MGDIPLLTACRNQGTLLLLASTDQPAKDRPGRSQARHRAPLGNWFSKRTGDDGDAVANVLGHMLKICKFSANSVPTCTAKREQSIARTGFWPRTCYHSRHREYYVCLYTDPFVDGPLCSTSLVALGQGSNTMILLQFERRPSRFVSQTKLVIYIPFGSSLLDAPQSPQHPSLVLSRFALFWGFHPLPILYRSTTNRLFPKLVDPRLARSAFTRSYRFSETQASSTSQISSAGARTTIPIDNIPIYGR